MSRLPRLIPIFAVLISLAACGQAGENPVAPAGPSLDGGLLVTGGNRTESDSSSTSTASTASANGDVESDTTNRGGLLVTGGN